MLTKEQKQVLDKLDASGITVSLAYGRNRWSVICMKRRGFMGADEFEKPYYSDDFDGCFEIAERQCRRRGWVNA